MSFTRTFAHTRLPIQPRSGGYLVVGDDDAPPVLAEVLPEQQTANSGCDSCRAAGQSCRIPQTTASDGRLTGVELRRPAGGTRGPDLRAGPWWWSESRSRMPGGRSLSRRW